MDPAVPPQVEPDASELPVGAILDDITAALAKVGRVLVEAPPGAGKSTALPLHLLRQGATPGRRVLLVQPRRLAARSIAGYLARCCGEAVGATVGLRTRFDSHCSAATRLEVITEGIFLRQIQGNPALQGVGWVLFDEFHERSWQADVGLTLALECQQALRDEAGPLGLVVMSATLPAARLSQWLAAPLVCTAGRQHPVAIDYRPGPRARSGAQRSLPDQVAGEVRNALAAGARKILVFLPGWGAIERAAQVLSGCDADIHRLHAAMPDAHAAALAPPGERPSVVLATNVAETSLTIAGVDTVIDSGLAKRPRYDARRGMDRLIEAGISQASATQRAGRAGRLGPGRCVRLWSHDRQGRLQPYDPPAIHQIDIVPALLELAVWGGAPELLPDPPEPPRIARAQESLHRLGALDARGWATPMGRRMVDLGVHPRLARLVLHGAERRALRRASLLAALLSEGDLPAACSPAGRRDSSVESRLALLEADPKQAPTIQRIAAQLRRRVVVDAAQLDGTTVDAEISPGALLLAGFPERLARRRSGDEGRFLTRDGYEVTLDRHDGLSRCEWLAIAALEEGGTSGSRARLAAALTAADVAALLESEAEAAVCCGWDTARGQVVARRQRRLGAIVLDELPIASGDAQAAEVWRGQIAQHGVDWLPWSEAARQWLARARWLERRRGLSTSFSAEALLATVDGWLLPWLAPLRQLSQWHKLDHVAVLAGRLEFSEQQRLAREAPSHWQVPSGQRHPLHYGAADSAPRLAARLPEFYGLDTHPQLAGEPLVLELRSPAGRPLQVTSDLPAFWRGAYAAVRKEMRGRYPKHFWPEEPWSAVATTTTRRRMAQGAG